MYALYPKHPRMKIVANQLDEANLRRLGNGWTLKNACLGLQVIYIYIYIYIDMNTYRYLHMMTYSHAFYGYLYEMEHLGTYMTPVFAWIQKPK